MAGAAQTKLDRMEEGTPKMALKYKPIMNEIQDDHLKDELEDETRQHKIIRFCLAYSVI